MKRLTESMINIKIVRDEQDAFDQSTNIITM